MDQQSVQSTNQPTPVEIPQEIRAFLEALLNDANITALDEAGREEMIKELYARLDNFLTAKLVDNLPPDQLENFIQMNEQGKSRPEVEEFLKSNIPNFSDVFTNAFMEFRDLYLGNVAVAKNEPASNEARTDQTS